MVPIFQYAIRIFGAEVPLMRALNVSETMLYPLTIEGENAFRREYEDNPLCHSQGVYSLYLLLSSRHGCLANRRFFRSLEKSWFDILKQKYKRVGSPSGARGAPQMHVQEGVRLGAQWPEKYIPTTSGDTKV